jgi:plasmid maintenance system antidote protein VapI
MEDYIKPMAISMRAVAIALHIPYSRLSEIRQRPTSKVRMTFASRKLWQAKL